jgi:hypothetical protein
MTTISITYTLVWQLNFANNYKFSKCKKLFNCKTNKEVRQVMNGGSIGYCINGRFYSLTFLKNKLEKIPKKEYCPF